MFRYKYFILTPTYTHSYSLTHTHTHIHTRTHTNTLALVISKILFIMKGGGTGVLKPRLGVVAPTHIEEFLLLR